MQLDELAISAYLEQLSSDSPTPGGGAAAGLTGAQAAALLSMTGNLSRGARYAAVAKQIEEIVQFCDGCRDRLVQLTNDDAAAFEALMVALGAPRGSEPEKKARRTLVQECLRSAAEVPLKIMQEVIRLTPSATILANIGNKQLISDVAVALQLIEAGLMSARLNVLVNLRQIKDPEFVQRTSGNMDALLAQFREEQRVCLLAIEQELPGASAG